MELAFKSASQFCGGGKTGKTDRCRDGTFFSKSSENKEMTVARTDISEIVATSFS